MTSPRMTLTLRLPMPHQGQQIVRAQARRFNWLNAHRRWRKTTAVMPLMVEAALGGGEYGWFAPTFRQVRIGWDEMRRACNGVADFNESRMDVTFPGGGRIRCASLDNPDNTRGWTLDGFAMDEASECPARAYYEVLRPMLMDTGGWAWFMFTPKGQNWTWREWVRADTAMRSGEDFDSAAWQIPASCEIVDGQLRPHPRELENPDIPFTELQDMFSRMPERVFRQEILAEFLEDAGGVFRGVEACVDPTLALADGPSHRMAQHVIGIDLAKHQDYTVLCVGDVRERRVVAFDRFNRADWGLQKARIVAAAKLWNDAVCWMDTTGVGDPIYDDLRRAGLRIHSYKFTHATKTALINNAALMVEQRAVRWPRVAATDVLTNELKAYEYSTSAGGMLTMSAPEGMHDDAVIAFALMCWPLGHAGANSLPAAALEMVRGTPVSDIGGARVLGKVF